MRAVVVGVVAALAMVLVGVGPARGVEAAASVEGLPVSVDDPRVGECFDRSDLTHWTLTGELGAPVLCTTVHQAQTIAFVDVTSLALPFSFAQAQALSTTLAEYATRNEQAPAALRSRYAAWTARLAPALLRCRAEMNRRIGVRDLSGGIRRWSLFAIDLTGPSSTRWAAGDRMARCDIVRALPADSAHPADRLLTLPSSLDGQGTALRNQYCWRHEQARVVVRPCASSAFARGSGGAWLTVYARIPMPTGERPATRAGAEQAAYTLCRRMTRAHTRATLHPLPNARVNFWVYHVRTGQASDMVSAWGSSAYRIGCAIPHWAYVP